MKSYRCFLHIIFFLSLSVFSQETKSTLLKNIDLKLKKALSLTYKFEYNKALELSLESLRQADSLKNDSLLGRSYITYGIINYFLGKEKEAILNQRKAEIIFNRTKNYKYLGSAYNNIGWVYSFDKQKLDSTIFYFEKALSSYTKAKNKKRIATALNNLAEKYIELDSLKKTESALKRALNLTLKRPYSTDKYYSLTYTYINFSKLLYNKNQLKSSLKYINLAEKTALKYNFVNKLKEVYQQKNKIFEKQKNYTKAYEYLQKYLQNLKGVYENEKSKVTQEMITKFEVEEYNRNLERIKIENKIKEDKIKTNKQLITVTYILLIILLFIILLFYKNIKLKLANNNLLQIKNNRLKELQRNTELVFLKNQIQPHFFFNTLNNIYSLIIEKSDQAQEVVLKLSELMKYTLYGSKTLTVPLEEEVNNIKNYLELEKLRYPYLDISNFKVIENSKNIKIPPLLYTTFIENCFKHNDVNNEHFTLSILFENINSQYLNFNVSNTFIPKKKNNKVNNGIGIKNVKRRLKIIYKEDYTLNISTKNNVFYVSLKIPI